MLYIPFLILTIMATIIASQAMISGVFSVVYQGITTRIMPLLRVDYTSTHLKSQIYIGSINWMLMLAVLFIMLIFQKSENLAAAYGLAVTGTMTITGVMMIMIFSRTTKKWKVPVAVAITLVDLVFFVSMHEQDTPWRLLVHHPGSVSLCDHPDLDLRTARSVPGASPA